MAKVRDNIITKGLSGKLGGLIVFRQVDGETIVTKAPVRDKYAPSEAQQKQVSRFQQAIRYAKQAMQNETLKTSYQQRAKGNRNAFNIAIADYLNAPVIEKVDTGKYKGTKGNRLKVRAVDDHKVAEVLVFIYENEGNLLEHGAATLQKNGLDWVYTAQNNLPILSGSRLLFRATDLAGNISEREVILM